MTLNLLEQSRTASTVDSPQIAPLPIRFIDNNIFPNLTQLLG